MPVGATTRSKHAQLRILTDEGGSWAPDLTREPVDHGQPAMSRLQPVICWEAIGTEVPKGSRRSPRCGSPTHRPRAATAAPLHTLAAPGVAAAGRIHIAAFEALGGVAQQILYDRMKTAVIGDDAKAGHIIYNRTLLDFARHYGFLPKACRPYCAPRHPILAPSRRRRSRCRPASTRSASRSDA